jgi:two-component system, LytTR family, response regulator
MTDIRVVLVEDEPPSRAKLRRLLDAHAEYQIVAEAEDIAGALAAWRNQRPDVVFLDIQLGAENGFDLLTRAGPPYPLIVFTTAYHEHALRAFEFAALDYLLKPFDRARFAQALARVGERLAARTPTGTIGQNRAGRIDFSIDRTTRAVEVPENDGAAPDFDANEERLRHLGALATPRLSRLVVHERGRSLVVPIAAVQRLSAAGNYVEVYTNQRCHLIRATLSRLAQRLDPVDFLRVHRSHLVRAESIVAIAPWAHGDSRLTLKDGSEIMLSRRYRALLPADWNRRT